MLCYIKSRATFRTSSTLTVIDYDIALNSVYDDASTITVLSEITGIEDDFICFDGWIGVVSSVSPEKGQTVITVKNILSAFNRALLPSTGATIEGFIKDTLESEYKNLSDAMYDMPYLTVSTETSTPFIVPDLDDNGLWSLKSYIAKVRRLKGVFCEWGLEGKAGLTCTIEARDVPSKRVDFADKSNRLERETYSRHSVAKVTAIAEGAETNYYLHTDGTHDTLDTDRVQGAWEIIVTDAEKQADAVAEVFAKSAYSHLIEFRSKREYGFYDNLQIRVGGRVLNSYVSCVKKSMKDGTLYKSGELRVTLVDKMKEMI
jgi:hypothetical protein